MGSEGISMNGIYAADTTVPVDRSKQEIEHILQRYGATEFASGWRSDKAMMQFRMSDRIVRFTLELPQQEEFKMTAGKFPRKRTEGQIFAAMQQAQRQRWRALALAIKAKLESVASKIEEFDTAFMGQIVMPNDKTMAEIAIPQIVSAYKSGKMPLALLEY
jgi:hypothetical protein